MQKMASSDETMEQIKECLIHKDYIGLKKFILEDKFSDENKFWDLLADLGDCISEENQENCPGFFETCERCMVYIINRGNPKELLLALLEQTDKFHETVKFKVFLTLVEKTLMKLSSKRQFSFELAVETLSAHIETLVLPSDLHDGVEGEEARLQDTDPKVAECLDALSAYLKFLSTFVDALLSENQSQCSKLQDSKRQSAVLIKYLLFTLDHPLVSLDLSFNSKTERPIKSSSRVCVERVVSLLLKLHPNFHTLIVETLQTNSKIEKLKSKDLPDADDQLFMRDDKPVPVMSLACLSYLVHCQHLGIHDYPWIFSQQSMMEFNLRFVLALLLRKDGLIPGKGVELFHCLVDRVEQSSLTVDTLDNKCYFDCLEALFDVMIHCPVKTIRQSCVYFLPYFIKLFDTAGRYQIFVKILATCRHPGVSGYCIQLLKNQINEILHEGGNSIQFFNINLLRLLEHILNLQQGPATDLLEHSDKIIAALNFLRYLVLKDPEQKNQTGIWNYCSDIEKYFADLRTGLNMSKGHYQMELTLMEEGKKDTNDGPEMTLSVAGLPMPKMDKGQKMEILRQALNTFDMIDSILCRVTELLEQQRRS